MNLLPNITRGWGLIWLIICLLLGGIVAFQTVDLLTNDSVERLVNRELEPHSEPALDMPQAKQLQLPALSYYKEVVERPLFTVSRRPLLEEEDGAIEEVIGQIGKKVRLTSIVIAPKWRFVLLQEMTGKKEVHRVEQGQRFSGWNVAEILPDRVLFRQGEKEEALKLREYKKFAGTPTHQAKKRFSKRKPPTARAKGPQRTHQKRKRN